MRRDPDQQDMMGDAPPAVSISEFANPVLQSLLESSRDCIKVLDLNGRIKYINPTGLVMRQLHAEADVVGLQMWELWPADSHDVVRDAIARAADGEQMDFRGFCPTARGRPKWWDVRIGPVYGAPGTITGVLAVSKDVTDAVTNRKMYDTIALEMRHRLKNAFAVASAIAKISARKHPEYQGFAEDLVARFSSLAVAQGKLVDTAADFPLRELVADLVDAAGVTDETIDVKGLPDCRVDESQMRVIAVVIGELTTNSLKYGALRSGGAVQCEGRIEDGWLHLSWVEALENADSFDAEDASSTSTGLTVINRIVMSAGGQVNREMTASQLRLDFCLVHPAGEERQD